MKRAATLLLLFPLVWLLAGLTTWVFQLGVQWIQDTPGGTSHPLRFDFYFFLRWTLITPAVYFAGRWVPLRRDRLVLRLIFHFVAGLLLTVAYESVEYVVERLFLGDPRPLGGWMTFLSELPISGLHRTTVFYWAVMAACQALLFYEQLQRKERERAALELEKTEAQRHLTEAKLQALTMRLRPHFLFNTLNTVNSLALRGDTEGVRGVIDRLGHLLRGALNREDVSFVRLRDELALAREYMALESVRFGDRLRVHWTIDPEIESVPTPTLLLQPILENAIVHGIGQRMQGGSVDIDVRREGESVVCRISDDGQGLGEGFDLDRDSGIGLSGTRDRLRLLYGERQSFEVCERSPRGTKVTVRWPVQELDPPLD